MVLKINRKILRKWLRNKKEQVEWILKTYPAARNSDTILLFYYWWHFEEAIRPYLREFPPLSVLKKLTPFETLSRWRRRIQAKGKYLPTDNTVILKRKQLAKFFAEEMVKDEGENSEI